MEFHRLAKPQPIWKLFAELCLAMVLVLVFVIAAALVFGENGTVSDVFILAAVLPVPFIAARVMGRDPAALVSVARRVRWGIVGKAALIAVPPYAVWLALAAVDGEFTRYTLSLLAALIVATPLQSATEEILFRATLPQLFGARLRSPWLAYGAAVVPFVALHIYNWIGLVDIFAFAVCTAYLTWRTGGIEAAVVLHAAGNIMVFGGEALHPGEAPLVDVTFEQAALSIAVMVAVTAVLALRLPSRQQG